MVCYYHLRIGILEISSDFTGSYRTWHLKASGHNHHVSPATCSTWRQSQAGEIRQQQQPQQFRSRTKGNWACWGTISRPPGCWPDPTHHNRVLTWSKVSALTPAHLGKHGLVTDLQFSVNMHIYGEEKENASYRHGNNRNGFCIQVSNYICKCF